MSIYAYVTIVELPRQMLLDLDSSFIYPPKNKKKSSIRNWGTNLWRGLSKYIYSYAVQEYMKLTTSYSACHERDRCSSIQLFSASTHFAFDFNLSTDIPDFFSTSAIEFIGGFDAVPLYLFQQYDVKVAGHEQLISLTMRLMCRSSRKLGGNVCTRFYIHRPEQLRPLNEQSS